MKSMVLLTLMVLLAPLSASGIIGLCNKKLSPKSAHSIGLLGITLSLLSALYLLKTQHLEESTVIQLYTWAKSHDFHLGVGLLVDRLSLMMISMVTFISWLVHLYSVGYMARDPGYQRFFSYIAFFTFGMLVLVLSNNFLQLFFGWEMVGLASYLLIGFWFHKESAVFAGLKAFIINRVGDCGFLIGIAGIWYCCGSLDYEIVFQKIAMGFLQREHAWMPTFICLALFIGAMGKSAQIPLHVWLPDSMEGPTPISALIHAATMVTAGVFMIARLSVLFECSLLALNTILVVGALTCTLMGLVALVQNDIKRIIAYSTLSQLGYMMMAMGASAYDAGIFHLLTHACFKALLFLAAGSIIMCAHHEQDIWKLGYIKGKSMPITYSTMLIASLALMGMPFFAGFYSKELVLESLRHSNYRLAPFAYYSALIGVLITTLYTFRLFFVVFHRNVSVKPHPVQEASWVITLPLIMLAVLSLALGILVLPYFEQLTTSINQTMRMGLQGFYQIPFIFNVLGILVCYMIYVRHPSFSTVIIRRCAIFYSILCKKYGFDAYYNKLFEGFKRLAVGCATQLEQYWIDGIAVNGSAAVVRRLSFIIRQWQTGYIYHYVFIMILAIMTFIAFCLWMPSVHL